MHFQTSVQCNERVWLAYCWNDCFCGMWWSIWLGELLKFWTDANFHLGKKRKKKKKKKRSHLKLYVYVFPLIQDQNTYWNFLWLYSPVWLSGILFIFCCLFTSSQTLGSENSSLIPCPENSIFHLDFLYPGYPLCQMPSTFSNQLYSFLLSCLIWEEQTVLS